VSGHSKALDSEKEKDLETAMNLARLLVERRATDLDLGLAC